MKALTPIFILIFSLASITACSGGSSTAVDSNNSSSGGVECYTMDEFSCAAYKATNAQRISNGVAAMSFCATCYAMASEQSAYMNGGGAFSHDRPTESYSSRVARFGLSGGGAGENIAYGVTGAAVVDNLWMNSSGHRANILNPNYKSFAVCTAGLYSTQVFYSGTNK